MAEHIIIYGGFACLIAGILSIIVEASLKNNEEHKESKYILVSSTITKLALFVLIGCIGYLLINALVQIQLNNALLTQKSGIAKQIKDAFNY